MCWHLGKEGIHSCLPITSVTRLGDFWKFFTTKFLAKEAQIIGNFLGYFEKPHSYVKTALASLGQLFEKLGYFLLQHLVTLPITIPVVRVTHLKVKKIREILLDQALSTIS